MQYRGVIVSEFAQQPPDPRRPPCIGCTVGYHAGPIADPETTHCSSEVLRRWPHEIQLLRRIGNIPRHVAELRAACERTGTGAIFAPNCAIGAVLMMRFASEAARHYPAVEIVEMHETGKKDAPSGTAMATARQLASAGKFARPPTTMMKTEGARGAELDGVGVHSLRLPGVVAHQEVLFGGNAELLSIRHDSFSRESFMPGLLLAVRAAATLDHFVDGLGELL